MWLDFLKCSVFFSLILVILLAESSLKQERGRGRLGEWGVAGWGGGFPGSSPAPLPPQVERTTGACAQLDTSWLLSSCTTPYPTQEI